MDVLQILEVIETQIKQNYIQYFDDVIQEMEILKETYFQKKDKEKEMLKKILEEASSHEELKYILLTFLMEVTGDKAYLFQIFEEISKDMKLTKENKYYLYHQLTSKVFTEHQYDEENVELAFHRLYQEIYQEYYNQMHHLLTEIPRQQRNQNVVLVLTCQVLTQMHAPTKTMLDRSYVMAKKFGKKVWIINTAEFMPVMGVIPVYHSQTANYMENLKEQSEYEYRGKKFSFFQCENGMPNEQEVRNIIQFVKKLRPCQMIQIGGSSIVGDLCSNLVPQLVVNTVHSKLSCTQGTYQVLGRKLKDSDLKILKEIGKDKNHVIEARFTFSIKEQKTHMSRQELGIPKERFVLLVVGYRLDYEMKEDFLCMLDKVLAKGLYVVFMGRLDGYEQMRQSHPLLKENSCFLSMVEDVLAVNECCDLYVNPIRNGGGSSVVEAFYKGLPGISCPIGDGSLGMPKEFLVENYEKMAQRILRLAAEPDYYQKMAKLAKQQAEYLLDSEGIFVDVVNEMERRENEKGKAKNE